MRRSRRAAHVVFVLLTALLLSGVIAFTLTFVRSGYAPGFFTIFLRQWTIAFIAAFPAGLVVIPAARAVADVVFK